MAVTVRFETMTNMEKLSCNLGSSATVIRYGEYVMVAYRTFYGFATAVYEFIETPDEIGLDWIECRLNLYEQADEYFEDGGHAIEWALGKITR